MSVQEYYTKYWEADGFNPAGGRQSTFLSNFMSRFLPTAPALILDAGCGDGLTAGPTIRGMKLEYQGVDIAPTAIEQAIRNGFNATVIEDLTRLPFPDAHFDGAVCIEVIEHLFDPMKAIREIFRVLKAGATLIVTTPNTVFWRRRLDYLILGRFNPVGDYLSIPEPWRDPHIRFFTRKSLRDMLAKAGFEPLAVTAAGGSFWPQLPLVGKYLRKVPTGPIYRGVERACPGWLGWQLIAAAKKPGP